MPTNLTPQYFEAEKRYRSATTPQEKVEALEEMLAVMPKHKGTDKLRADLRTKIAKFTEEAQRKPVVGKKGSLLHRIVKEGAGQVVLVGLPNAGKSSIVSAVTESQPIVAPYPFTTQSPVPGMMKYENIQFQLVDVPALNAPHVDAWLRNIVRGADLLLVAVDLALDPLAQMEEIMAHLQRYRVKIVDVPDEAGILVDKKAVIVGTMADIEGAEQGCRDLKNRFTGLPVVCLSTETGHGVEELGPVIYRTLDVVRIYTKVPGQKPDMSEPVVMPRGSTIEDVAESVHKDFVKKLKYAQIWGSAKFDGQKVKRNHVVQEGDIVELHA